MNDSMRPRKERQETCGNSILTQVRPSDFEISYSTMQHGAEMRTALSGRLPKIGTFGAQNRNGQRYSVTALGNSVNVLSRSGNGTELNTEFEEWSGGIAESAQVFLWKAEACVGAVV